MSWRITRKNSSCRFYSCFTGWWGLTYVHAGAAMGSKTAVRPFVRPSACCYDDCIHRGLFLSAPFFCPFFLLLLLLLSLNGIKHGRAELDRWRASLTGWEGEGGFAHAEKNGISQQPRLILSPQSSSSEKGKSKLLSTPIFSLFYIGCHWSQVSR